MSGIRTGVELQDNFTDVMDRIINSVNIGVQSLDELQQTMNQSVNTSGFNDVRSEIDAATAAVSDLQSALNDTVAPTVSMGAEALNVNVTPVVTEQPQIDVPDDITVPVSPAITEQPQVGVDEITIPVTPVVENQPDIKIPDFDVSGVQRYSEQVQTAENLLQSVSSIQQTITNQSQGLTVIPDDMKEKITDVNSTIARMQQALNILQSNSFDMDSQAVEQQIIAVTNELNRALEVQRQLSDSLSHMDIEIEQPPPVEVPVEPQIPGPVQVPVEWQSDNLDVFTSTGVDRFRQEVSSANTMLEQLSSTQDAIARQAFNTNIFPPEMFQDLNSMAVRIDMVRDRIQQIGDNPINVGTDAANTELERLRSQLSQALQAQNNLNIAMQNMDVGEANIAYAHLSQTVSNTERYIRDNVDEQGRFNRAVQDADAAVQGVSNGFTGWQKGIIVANQAMNLICSTVGRLGLMDVSGAFDRIDTMNRFQHTVSVITGSTEQARAALNQLKDTTLGTAYGLDVAASATQGFLTRGMSLGTATNQVRVWADAVSFYGDGTNAQLENVVDAIGKMYSKGKVEADQLDRLFDAGIGAAEMYADAMGMSVSKVKDDLSSGAISAANFIDVVSQTLDSGISSGAAKDAGNTWATTFANLQAAVTRGWTDVITKLDAALASHGLPSAMEMIQTFGQRVEGVLNDIGNAMYTVVGIAESLYDTATLVGGFIADNWSVISPIVYGVAAALAVYYGWLLLTKAAELATAAIQGAAAVVKGILAAGYMILAGATWKAATTQYGLNGAMYACPIVWIIILIIALIAIIFAVCSAIAHLTGVANSGFGVITGGINVVIQFFKNLGLSVANIALGIGSAIGALASNMMTAFSNAISSVQAWFYDLLSTACSVIAGIAEALNKLPFVEFDYSGISAAADSYAAKSAEAAGSKEDYTSISDAFSEGMSTFDTFQDGWASDAFASGAAWGDGIADKVSNFSLSDIFGTDIPNVEDYTSGVDDALANSGMGDNLGDIAGDTGAIKDGLDITSEDLKYLRDIAEQEEVNRYTTAEIKIEQTNNNNVSGDMDLDGIVQGLSDAVDEATEIIIGKGD